MSGCTDTVILGGFLCVCPPDDAANRKTLLIDAVAYFDHVHYSSLAFSIIGSLLWFPDIWAYLHVRITTVGEEKLEYLGTAATISVCVFLIEDLPQTVC